jgi:hypothetical protein
MPVHPKPPALGLAVRAVRPARSGPFPLFWYSHSQQLLVSRTVADLVAGGAFQLKAVGDHQLKGVQGTWALYEVDIT